MWEEKGLFDAQGKEKGNGGPLCLFTFQAQNISRLVIVDLEGK